MTVRAKFFVESKKETTTGFDIEMSPVTSGGAENNFFFKWTPTGKLDMRTINKGAVDEFEVGKEYYIDFTKALPVETKAAA